MLDLTTPCKFLPNKLMSNGYVRIMRDNETWLGHRWAYTMAYGPIPDGHVVEHECHNMDKDCPGGDNCRHRACVNPLHLVARTRVEKGELERELNLTTDVCRNGHQFTEANTYWQGEKRSCRFCRFLKYQEEQRREKARQFGIEWKEVPRDDRRVRSHD